MKLVLTQEEVKNILMDWLVEHSHLEKGSNTRVIFSVKSDKKLEVEVITT